MGGGAWTTTAFASYSTSVGKAYDSSTGRIDVRNCSTKQVFKNDRMAKTMNPKNVIRECRDTDEHPKTIPVILGIDVTGSMGDAAKDVASKLNDIIMDVKNKVDDAEFMVMGIGDLYYDDAPLQASQFESDVRIAKHLDDIYFESGGGGNDSESYTAAWYFGANNTDLDCWKRGKKGIIITIGDEPMNTALPVRELNDNVGCNIRTLNHIDALKSVDVYNDASQKYDIYHIHVNHDNESERREAESKRRFTRLIGDQRFFATNIDGLNKIISNIIIDRQQNNIGVFEKPENDDDVFVKPEDDETQAHIIEEPNRNENGEIVW